MIIFGVGGKKGPNSVIALFLCLPKIAVHGSQGPAFVGNGSVLTKQNNRTTTKEHKQVMHLPVNLLQRIAECRLHFSLRLAVALCNSVDEMLETAESIRQFSPALVG
jgi:hypothetical protein